LFQPPIHKVRFIGYHSHKGFFMYAGEERRLMPGYFQALAHPTRLRIMDSKSDGGEMIVN
jgi:hypothetical protein